MAALKKLKIKLAKQKNALARTNEFFEGIQSKEIDLKLYNEIQIRFDKLTQIYDQFNEVQTKIECYKGVEINDEESKTFENNYFSLYGRMQEVLQKFSHLLEVDDRSVRSSFSSRASIRSIFIDKDKNNPNTDSELNHFSNQETVSNHNDTITDHQVSGNGRVDTIAGQASQALDSEGTTLITNGNVVTTAERSGNSEGATVRVSQVTMAERTKNVSNFEGPIENNMNITTMAELTNNVLNSEGLSENIINIATMADRAKNVSNSEGAIGNISDTVTMAGLRINNAVPEGSVNNNNNMINNVTAMARMANNNIILERATNNSVNSSEVGNNYFMSMNGNGSQSSFPVPNPGQIISNNSLSYPTSFMVPQLYVPQVQLPLMKLPIFDGDFNKWLEFRDSFQALIDSQPGMTDVQRLHYLRSSLTENVLETIKSIPVSSQNYRLAWQVLTDRYEKSQLIVRNHVNNILKFSCLSRESAKELRDLYNVMYNNIESLRNLGEPVDHWNAMLIPIIYEKLDFNSKREWEKACAVNPDKTTKELFKFIKTRCEILEKLESNRFVPYEKSKQSFRPKSRSVSHQVSTSSKPHCKVCQGVHPLHKCDQFLKMSVNERWQIVRSHNLCRSCFQDTHSSFHCTFPKCKNCGKAHSSLLHMEFDRSKFSLKRKANSPDQNKNRKGKVPKAAKNGNNGSNSESQTVQKPKTNELVTAHAAETVHSVNQGQGILPTAIILIQDNNGEFHECRALLDDASMSSFISLSLCKKLKLNKRRVNYCISGVGESRKDAKFAVTVKIKSKHSDYERLLSCLAIDTVTSDLPLYSFSKKGLQLPKGVRLADPKFNESRPIDLLIGAALYWELLEGEKYRIPDSGLFVNKTTLGWVVGGILNHPLASEKKRPKSVTCLAINQQLAKFWEIEEVRSLPKLSKADQFCEDHFMANTTRDDEGQFVVKVPFKDNLQNLGQSREMSKKRFLSIEKKLINNPKLHKEYSDFMDEYEQLGHMEEISESLIPEEVSYYIPHHAVVREASSTTKTRVVFDASMKTDYGKGLSLNDVQYSGPAIQNELISILLNFRLHEYVMSADICKMYRMIRLSPDQRKFHRIFWRKNPSEELKIYELKTVTYGTASAPYLAIRCLHELADQNSKEFPEACKVIRKGFYVDDLLWGASSKEQLIKIQREVNKILASAKFDLRKWICNDIGLCQQFDFKRNLDHCIVQIGDNTTNKTLGVYWNASSDTINYSCNLPSITLSPKLTKRIILSEISQVYDPLGLIGPVIFKGKILMQKMWQDKLGWDDSVSSELKDVWVSFRNDLYKIQNIVQPRLVKTKNATAVELHGFADASEKGYGAAIYMRSRDSQGNCQSSLLCAKNKVAPLKKLSLPRLELCAALLLALLMEMVKKAIDLNVERTCFWSDSTVTLSWIKGCPSNWKTFVANRVSEIQTKSNPSDWHHVISKENPADLLSRGVNVENLAENKLWWCGPEMLLDETLSFKTLDLLPNDKLPEVRKPVSLSLTSVTNKQPDYKIFNLYSNFNKLLRVVAHILRFKNNTKKEPKNRQSRFLKVTELDEATETLCRLAQMQAFPKEYEQLLKGMPLDDKSVLSNLNPIMSENKVLRVGGRLQNSKCSLDQKHPIILPKKHELTNLLFENMHEALKHCGPSLLLSALRERFWIVHGKNAAREFVRKCTTCFKANPKGMHYIMGTLPEMRVNQYLPFYNVGIDYGGPFLIKDRKITRNAKLIKAYICLFVCLSTKAIHLELVTDLTTESFLACLKRFISRRGKPSNIISDNATNFLGASSELKNLKTFLEQNEEKINKQLAFEGIQWHFIPPRAPSFGGIWEAGIKSVKYHLLRTAGSIHHDYEEFSTLLCQIEAILNSRPLCPLTSDPEDLDPLTPGHFLIGRRLTNIPDRENLLKVPENRLRHFQRVQKIVQDFWARWRKEYLNELQIRTKWKKNHANITKGTLVILKEDNVPHIQWPMGRVVEVYPGRDGVIRVVDLKVKNKVIRRPVTKIYIIPQTNPEQESE